MRSFCLCFFLFLPLVIHAQSRILDSLYTELKNHPQEDTVRVNLLTGICYREYTSSPEKSKAHAEEIMSISHAIGFGKGICYGYRYTALYYWATGDYEKATHYTYEMLREAEKITFTNGMGMAYQLLGVLDELEKNFGKAKLHYEQALAMYEKMNAKRSIGYAYNSLGSLHQNSNKLDQALSYYLRSLEIRKEINDEDGLSQTYNNLAHVYMFRKEYTLARRYFEMAMPILKKLDNRYRIAGTYSGMGELYNLMGNYDQAQAYYLQAIEWATAIHHKMILKETYAQLTQMEKKRGRFEKALNYFELATAYNDSLYNEGKAKTIAELETRYESEKKDQQIQLLARDNRIRALWSDILIAALALVAAVSVLFYYLQRYREKKNRQILNLEIEQLTTQHRELSEKYKNVLSAGTETAMDSQDQRILKRAIEVVEENISDPAFSVEKMAREMGMSRTNMHRKIKAITGFPPNELIRSIRLRKAALMLLHQTDTVSQISLTVGFEDHSYFSKAFKKQFGVPPSEYFQSRGQA